MAKGYKPFVLWRLWFFFNAYLARRADYDLMRMRHLSPGKVEWIQKQGYTVGAVVQDVAEIYVS